MDEPHRRGRKEMLQVPHGSIDERTNYDRPSVTWYDLSARPTVRRPTVRREAVRRESWVG